MYPLISNKLVFLGEENCYSYSIMNTYTDGMEIDTLGDRTYDLILSLNDSQVLCINKIRDFSTINHIDFTDYDLGYLKLSDSFIDISSISIIEAMVINNIIKNFDLPTKKYNFINNSDIKGVSYSNSEDSDVYKNCYKLNLLINNLNNLDELVTNFYQTKREYDIILSNPSVVPNKRETFLSYVININKISIKNFQADLFGEYKKILYSCNRKIKHSHRPEFVKEYSKFTSVYIPDQTYSLPVYKSCQSYHNHQTVSYVSANLSRQPTMQGLNFGLM